MAEPPVKSNHGFANVFKLSPSLADEVNVARQISEKGSAQKLMTKSSSFGNFLMPFMNKSNMISCNSSVSDVSIDEADGGLQMKVKSDNIAKQNCEKSADPVLSNSKSMFNFQQFNNSNNDQVLLKGNEDGRDTFFNRLFKPDSKYLNNKEFNVMAPSSH